MKKKLLSLLMCGVIGISCLYGCGDVKIDPVDGHNNTDEYEIISSSNISVDEEIITVKEKNTGKIFKIYKGYNKGGITEVSK